MNQTSTIPKRKEVNPNETWDLSDLYSDFSAWEKDYLTLPTESQLESKLNESFKGKLHTSPALILECLQFRDEITRKLGNLYVYANLRSSEDVADKQANEFCGKIENKMASLQSLFAFLEPELLSIEALETWTKEKTLAPYTFPIQELLRSKPHILSEKEEALVSKLSVPLYNFSDIHSKWNNADLKFQNAKDSEGKEHIVSNARYGLNLQSYDRTLRENTFQSYYTEIAKWRNTITANYYGNMIRGSLLAKIRNFSGYLESELFNDDIPVSLYENLIATVRKNLDALHESMEIRKHILGVESVALFDRYVSLYHSQKEPIFSWEEGRDLVLEAIKPLGDEYFNIAKAGLTTERWIDRAENEGKRSGAFSWGTYDSRPYMLQTWNGSLSDVYTLAHELGHSMHSYYSNKNQPYHLSNYTIFVAEVASTLNEALLTDYILKNKSGTDLSNYVLSESIKNFEGTVLRQMLFATFEKEAARIADAGETFTPDSLEEIYLSLNKEWYGSHSSYPEFLKHEWMRIPHFYSAFYVYKYATSFCASLALSEMLKQEPEQTRERIFGFLKTGGSKPSLDILKLAGVDFLDGTAVNNAFQNYRKNLQMAKESFLKKA
jgi:oligoendopeptidase F